MMQNQNSIKVGTIFSATISQVVQLLAALFLSGAILYGAGFAQTPAAHNATHDVRHAQGFPCH